MPGRIFLAAFLLALATLPATAAEAHGLPGSEMSLLWALPFAGILLSIATGPLLYAHFWEHHYGKISALWAALVIVPMALAFGPMVAAEAVAHTMLLEYISFIILLFALFTIAGGIWISGNIHGTPAMNAILLAIGMVLASIVGTTGASMIMIRPLIRANDNRPFNVHVVVFFIFLVSNIGGSLTPLGDPPLFVGFLRGVDFFWTTQHLIWETLFVGGLVLAVFVGLDVWLHVREDGLPKIKDPTPDSTVRIFGTVNFLLLAGVIGSILLSASWKPGVAFTLLNVPVELQNLVRDVLILALAITSLFVTRRQYRIANGFSWGPIKEVAKLFAGIFICIIPVIAILKAGMDGALAPLVSLVTGADGAPNELAYFWMTGILSSFLDNAPTYLVFFELAGGDPQTLMTTLGLTLTAISAGAVFMGANTYIGNAPNFMVYAIAREQGVSMPSFFGYMLWSGAVLIPTFVIAGFLFFW
ncbi:MAG: sodium:proton antiporter [Mesorhizobium sp.]|nr:sodium:proton antiporter [Mesorhizobium sp.]MCO5160087.1 sodium:proton antiporter [Mesorhizobium sp.]